MTTVNFARVYFTLPSGRRGKLRAEGPVLRLRNGLEYIPGRVERSASHLRIVVETIVLKPGMDIEYLTGQPQ